MTTEALPVLQDTLPSHFLDVDMPAGPFADVVESRDGCVFKDGCSQPQGCPAGKCAGEFWQGPGQPGGQLDTQEQELAPQSRTCQAPPCNGGALCGTSNCIKSFNTETDQPNSRNTLVPAFAGTLCCANC